MPLSEVDNELTRSMSGWTSVSSRVLLNSMHDVAKKVGMALEVTLGICFGIMFDGWSSGSMHYVAVYGVFETDGNLRLQLLAVSPLDDGSQNVDAHIKLFDGVLDVYNKAGVHRRWQLQHQPVNRDQDRRPAGWLCQSSVQSSGYQITRRV
ncbi:hypothetical protein PC129_g22165 [Phytophthora cactorum]|uniref:Uncharacterized protein n=1 Tax=Phytophthora cactorum TaxID=29920 RepID=A0A8T0YFS8_9STRA|nr:hypothetical protein Pcac1_g2787 [Phytophthora cactorum]KAG2814319.1 hypothetical protein PC111_g14041 [Phytophthora cactorum]KAG2820738.1 hypothetical protein PC113_g22570 [Phytophthora cactorum]KAG2874461.1 hypothetical protein PC114_g25268 [Phytophthora cactorum]KAG2887885.1 hypothetical protein PC117_g25054 [Phytophthora cactorum]